MKKLIINADDFGYNKEITDGIVQCHLAGTVTSTTMMVNMKATEYAASLVSKYPKMSVGLHINLSLGKSVSPPNLVSGLLDKDGNFLNHQEVFRLSNRFKLPSGQIEREMRAQIELFLSLGLEPSHSDTHHHVGASLQIFPIRLKLLKEYKINKIRTHRSYFHGDRLCQEKTKMFLMAYKKNFVTLPTKIVYELEHLYAKAKGFTQPSYRYSLPRIISQPPLQYTIEGWKRFIYNTPSGIGEVTVHPGLFSNDEMDSEAYRKVRVEHLKLLIDPKCKEIFDDNKIELINFRDI